ncbi:MAG: 5'/3'-nucleotidase SurE [Spirochaetota bacterium]
MNILLTNDDGVHAKGINTLFDILSEKHHVFIIAPTEEKSGSSTAISFIDNFKVIHISENKYAVPGFPADCVNMGLRGDIIPKVDLVISGINHGSNLGDDVHFSGTVGGARVAHVYGISGIAISLNRKGESEYFVDASRFLLNYIQDTVVLNNGSYLLNINYPDLPSNKIQGVKYSSLGKRKYNDYYKVTGRKDEEIHLEYNHGIGSIHNDISDITELEKGYITITPLALDCTDYNFLNKITNKNSIKLD